MAFLDTLRVYRDRDPAARSLLEAALFAPGLHALAAHRFAHVLLRAGLRIPARVIAYVTRALTGIEIHPAARLGRRVFIDHGSGLVIGETAVVGDDAWLFHGVTLGSVRIGETAGDDAKRHPTVGDRVVVGAHAQVLGPIRVGSDVRIGAGAIVLRDVPDRSLVIGTRARTESLLVRALPESIEFQI